jgi:hypothetical protein
MKKYFRSNFITILALFLAAVVITAAVYPDLFITFKTSFILWNDYCIDYPLTFVLTNFFYQGGIQLWDFFGQMPFFHTYAVFGIFKFPNIITAITYYLLAPFSDDSGRLFHHVFAWANLMTLLFIRTVGIYLLLKIVTKNRIILSLATVIFAVFFSQWAFLKGGFYMSYMPLGMYFIVRFFQEIQWRYLAAMIVFIFICLGNGMHYGAYMYLSLHFFIISGIVWSLIFNPASKGFINGSFWRSLKWKDIAGVILVAVLIMAPYAYIIKFGFPDLAFGQDNSRITHPFSLYWYFHNPDLDLGSPRTFFSAIFNMPLVNAFMNSLGLAFLFLTLAGLVLSRNKLKYFFALGILLLWLLSFPRGFNIGLIAHLLNALTNPLKTLARSYYFASQAMLPYLTMPLVVMGIESMIELFKGKKYPGLALGLWGLLTVVFVLNGSSVLPVEVRIYPIICTVWLLGGIAWIHFKDSPRARNFLIGTVCFLAIIDILLIIHQTRRDMSVGGGGRRPMVFDVAPQAGMVEYDFENPTIFPYRYSYTLHFSFKDEPYLWFPHSVSSDLHHVINQGLNYVYLNGYNPRHIQFVKWLNDPPNLAYLQQNNEFIFLAQTAINSSPDALSRITSAGLARQVVEVEDPGNTLNLPDQWPDGITGKEANDLQYEQLAGTLENVSLQSECHLQGDRMVYVQYLPANFPEHLASSWFPAEQRYLRFFIEGAGQQWQELSPVQGELIRPNTFDVQNIRKGQLRAMFSKDDFPMHRRCVLLYPSSQNQGVESLWEKQFDNLGIVYRAKRDGWWVGHYPYDKKWRISVDGKPVTYYRVNESFIGFPLSKGEHKILIQYWPGSPLRILLLISALLTTLGLPVLIFLAMKWEKKIDG